MTRGGDDGLILALPSKGRLQEQCAEWLADVGFSLDRSGGERGYAARLAGAPNIEVRLLQAREIAQGLDAGTIHVGVTGLDLLHEVCGAPDERLYILADLGFGRADLLVAAPQSWVDVRTMGDLGDVAARERGESGRQLTVATKYPRLTRRYFAAQGIADYRTVASQGATEGAPASGAADVIVDITTTGRTLAANGLRVLPNDAGLILRSEAKLAAALTAPWSPSARAGLRMVVDRLEARKRAQRWAMVSTINGVDVAAASELTTVRPGPGGSVLCLAGDAASLAARLRDETGADVIVTVLSYAFTTEPTQCDLFFAAVEDAPAHKSAP